MIIIFKEKSNEFLKQTESFYIIILNRKFGSKIVFFSIVQKIILKMGENKLCFNRIIQKKHGVASQSVFYSMFLLQLVLLYVLVQLLGIQRFLPYYRSKAS